MITEAILEFLMGLVEFLIDLLPDDSIDWPDAAEFGSYVGGVAGPLDHWLPLAEFVAVTVLTITVVLPALLIYKMSMWLWSVIPIPK